MNISARYDKREVRQDGWILTEFKRDINGKTFTFYRYINQPDDLPHTTGVEVENGVWPLHTFYFSEQQSMLTLD